MTEEKRITGADRIEASLQRAEKERRETMATIETDGTNFAVIPGYPYKFEAAGKHILVAVDIFVSGFECKECKGVGEKTRQYLSEITKQLETLTEPCEACKGKGALIIIPEQSKSIATSGVIVSVGSNIATPEIKRGRRVLFGPFSGQLIPTKAIGVAFRTLTDHEILVYVSADEKIDSFDFTHIDKPLEDKFGQ